MARYRPKDFMAHIKEALPPSVLFVGDEVTLMHKALARIREQVLGENWELNWTVLSGKEESLSCLEEAVCTVPFGASKRVVVVRHVLDLWKGCGDADRERLVQLFISPPFHIFLVLIHEGVLSDNPRGVEEKAFQKLVGLMEEKAVLVSFVADRKALARWIEKCFRKEGVPLKKEEADWLLDVSQGSMVVLEQEIEKLLLSGMMEGEAARTLPPFWEIPAMVYRRDRRLLDYLEDFASVRGYPYLLRIISSAVVRLAVARVALEEGENRQEILRRLSPYPRERDALDRGLRECSIGRMDALLDKLMETELSFKSSAVPKDMVMEDLVLAVLEGTTL